jgi:hypothetical protein
VVDGGSDVNVAVGVDASVTVPGAGVIVVMSVLVLAGAGRAARPWSDSPGTGACGNRLLSGHFQPAACPASPARSTDRFDDSQLASGITGVRPGGRTPLILHPWH